MKNKTESNLSRKGIFGSLWRWFKGKIASSCKLSLGISSDISDEKKKQKIDELVKKIQGWDVSYYPGDRINAILDLGAESTDRNGKSTKIKWSDLDNDKQEIVLTKLVGFLNRISYGDYTGGPSSNSNREQFMKNIYKQSKDAKNVILKQIEIQFFTTAKEIEENGKCAIVEDYDKKKKITNLCEVFHDKYKYHVWCCLTKTKNNKYEDGMNGDYLKLLLTYAKPEPYKSEDSFFEKEISLYQDTAHLTNTNDAISDKALLRIDRYNNRKKETRQVIIDDLNTVHSAIIFNSYYPTESYFRVGIALLKYLKVNEKIYKSKKNLENLKNTALEDAPLIILLLDWSSPELESNGVRNLNIEIIKKGTDFVVMKGNFAFFLQYYLFYIDKTDKKLKYLRNDTQYDLGQNAKEISALPEDCKKALEYYLKNEKWEK